MSLYGKRLGSQGEDLAVDFLAQKGMQILHRNYRGFNQAEVDIIAQDGRTLVFVEVKTFASNAWQEGPAVNVTPAKQRQVIRGARAYLMALGEEPYCRFDVVAVRLGPKPQVEHFKGAFSA